VDLESGETLVWDKRTNHTAGVRAVGGKLYPTDRRVVFESRGIGREVAEVAKDLSEAAAIREDN
jgi:hypothetical protein